MSENIKENKIINKIDEMSLHLNKIILSLSKDTNIKNIPNIANRAHNKLIELQKQFQNAGTSLYSKESIVGETIIDDVIDFQKKGLDYIISCDDVIKKHLMKRNSEQSQELINFTPLKKFFMMIRNVFMPKKQEEKTLACEEEIKSIVQKYINISEELWKYNLEDNIVESIVNKIRREDFKAFAVPAVLEECVIPDLQKLGLLDKIPEIQLALIEEYKKDLPASEIQQISEEDMHLYVPDFSENQEKNNQKVREELQKEKEQIKQILANNGVTLEDLSKIDGDVDAQIRQILMNVIQSELQ